MSKLSDGLGAVFGWLFWIGLIGLMFVPMVTSDDDSGSSPTSANTGESSAYPESDSNIDYDPTPIESSEPELADYPVQTVYSEPSYRSNYDATYDMDCSDFSSQSEAQYYFENIADDNLDGDGDGYACESL